MAADGILVIAKPEGRSSRWTANHVARLLLEKKAGHLGTLDPLAAGVLPVLLGQATRLAPFLETEEKIYRAVIRLGVATDTQDREGRVISRADPSRLDPAQITAAVAAFQGQILQVPPMFSALKKEGVPLYRLARKGISVPREPRRVHIKSITLESITLPDLRLRVVCGPGVYLRTLAHDLGQKLACGAYLHSLVRLQSGPFTLDQAVEIKGLDPETARQKLLPLCRCLPHLPSLQLEERLAENIRQGKIIPWPPETDLFPGRHYALLEQERLLAVALAFHREGRAFLRPLRVFCPAEA